MGLDLLSYPELKDAEADLASAYARQAEAQRRFRLSPHGERTARLTALQEAVQQALRAELKVVALKAGEA